MNTIIQTLLETYCRYKQVKLEHPHVNLFRISKRGFRISDVIVEQGKVTLQYQVDKEELTFDEFTKQMEKDIEQIKFLQRTRPSRKRTFPLQYTRMKLVEHGVAWCHDKGDNQNRKFLGIPDRNHR